MKNEHHSLITVHIGDLCINSVLDTGFIGKSEMAPIIHSHASYELLLATNGDFQLDVSGKEGIISRITLRKGDACLIPMGVYHSTRSSCENSTKLALRFCISRNEKKSKPTSIFSYATRTLHGVTSTLTLNGADELSEIVEKIKKELSVKSITSEEYIVTLLTQLYISLLRELNKIIENNIPCEPIASEGLSDRRTEIEEYLYDHFDEPLTEEDLAKKMNVSKRQLSRIISDLFGTSFRQMLIDIRLNRASQLLTETELPIEEIALAVGYSSVSGFYTAFRKRFSLSAGKYRLLRK